MPDKPKGRKPRTNKQIAAMQKKAADDARAAAIARQETRDVESAKVRTKRRAALHDERKKHHDAIAAKQEVAAVELRESSERARRGRLSDLRESYHEDARELRAYLKKALKKKEREQGAAMLEAANRSLVYLTGEIDKIDAEYPPEVIAPSEELVEEPE